MKAHELEVFVRDGVIVIAQTRMIGICGTDESVEVDPGQVDMLVEWLKQAQDELKK